MPVYPVSCLRRDVLIKSRLKHCGSLGRGAKEVIAQNITGVLHVSVLPLTSLTPFGQRQPHQYLNNIGANINSQIRFLKHDTLLHCIWDCEQKGRHFYLAATKTFFFGIQRWEIIVSK